MNIEDALARLSAEFNITCKTANYNNSKLDHFHDFGAPDKRTQDSDESASQ